MDYTGKRIALVTGANSGMGKATCSALAGADVHTVMLCRDRARGEQALRDVLMESGGTAELILCNLASLRDVARFCDEFRAEFSRLDILVCNAGVITLDRRETEDGLELQFGVNHVSHFMLTNSLLPLMAPGSRIVVVGSGAHRAGRLNFDDMGMERGYNVVSAYGRAKLCNLLFTRELSRRLRGTGITANCVHPGAVATNMGMDRETGFGKGIMAALAHAPVFQTPAEGAATAVYVALAPECAGVTGEYWYRKAIAPSSKRSQSVLLAERLWTYSDYLVKTLV